jgi:hypothetical protein
MIGLALKKIEAAFDEFIGGVERCKIESFDPANFKDAIMRFSRLRERYEHEKKNLKPSERQALSKVFEKDNYVEIIMKNLRQVTEHVVKRTGSGLELVTAKNEPIPLLETSAGAFYSARTVYLPRIDGKLEKVDLLEIIEELKKRVSAAMNNAKACR